MQKEFLQRRFYLRFNFKISIGLLAFQSLSFTVLVRYGIYFFSIEVDSSLQHNIASYVVSIVV